MFNPTVQLFSLMEQSMNEMLTKKTTNSELQNSMNQNTKIESGNKDALKLRKQEQEQRRMKVLSKSTKKTICNVKDKQ